MITLRILLPGLWAAAAGGLLFTIPDVRGADARRAPEKAPARPELSSAELERIGRTMDALSRGFLAGDADAVMGLFTARGSEEESRHAAVATALQREFRSERYTAFEVLEISGDDRLSDARHSLWIRLRGVYVDRASNRPREGRHNEIFIFERLGDGSFALVDSPYFDCLGRQRGLSLTADAIFGAIVILAVMTFWVWMGYEAFRLRPRSDGWRAAVLAMPVIGALLFFVIVYRSLWRRKTSAEF